MDCFIRKNYLTINEDPEIWEIVECATGGVAWFGTAAQLSEVLATDNWDLKTNVFVDGNSTYIDADL